MGPKPIQIGNFSMGQPTKDNTWFDYCFTLMIYCMGLYNVALGEKYFLSISRPDDVFR